MATSMLTCPHCACDLDPGEHDDGRGATRAGAADTPVMLSLLGGFSLVEHGAAVTLQPGAQRVVAYAALQRRPVPRSVVAGTLWPETTDGRAAASLRSALWRLGTVDGALMRVDQGTIALSPAVDVDVLRLNARAQRLLSPRTADPGPATTDGAALTPERPAAAASAAAEEVSDTALFETELLPGWCDEWVIAERERLRILQLAALEQVGVRLLLAGRYTRALDVGLRLTMAEPLRESTHRLIVRAYLSQGNRADAVRHYLSFRELLWRELEILPSAQMERLVATARDPAPN